MNNKGKVIFLSTFCDFFWDFEQENIRLVKEMGYEVVLVSNCGDTEKSKHKKDLEALDLTNIHIPFERKPFPVRTVINYFRLKRLLAQQKPAAVDCHLAVVGTLTRLVCRGDKSVRVIYSPHGFFFYRGCPWINSLIYRNVERLLSRYTDALITINGEDYASAQRMKLRGKAYFVNGVGVDIQGCRNSGAGVPYLRKELSIPEERFIFHSVGELNRNKNHRMVLKAMVRLREEGIENFHYVICGKGEEEEKLISYGEAYGLGDRVHLLGYREDVIRLNQQVNVFILPSFKEGLSVSIIEAMSCGLPVIASRIRGNVDLIDEGKGGALFEPSDEAGLAEIMKYFMEHKERCREMGTYNREKSSKYSKEQISQQMKEIYSSLLKGT